MCREKREQRARKKRAQGGREAWAGGGGGQARVALPSRHRHGTPTRTETESEPTHSLTQPALGHCRLGCVSPPMLLPSAVAHPRRVGAAP